MRAFYFCLQAGLRVKMQLQALLDVFYGHAVSRNVCGFGVIRIGQNNLHLFAAGFDGDVEGAVTLLRLDTVVHRVFNQRLQDQRRHQRLGRHVGDVPFHFQPIAQADLFDLQILAAQGDFILERF